MWKSDIQRIRTTSKPAKCPSSAPPIRPLSEPRQPAARRPGRDDSAMIHGPCRPKAIEPAMRALAHPAAVAKQVLGASLGCGPDHLKVVRRPASTHGRWRGAELPRVDARRLPILGDGRRRRGFSFGVVAEDAAQELGRGPGAAPRRRRTRCALSARRGCSRWVSSREASSSSLLA